MDPIVNDNDMNNEMNDTQALLTAYALGELEGADLAKAEALIASDPAAKAEVEEIRRVGKQLEEALAAEGAGATGGLKPEQVQAIHARAEKEPETQEAVVARLVRPWVWWTAGSAAAAMFAIALILPVLGTARRSERAATHTRPNVAMVEKNDGPLDHEDYKNGTLSRPENDLDATARRSSADASGTKQRVDQLAGGKDVREQENGQTTPTDWRGAAASNDNKVAHASKAKLADKDGRAQQQDLSSVAIGAVADSASRTPQPSAPVTLSESNARARQLAPKPNSSLIVSESGRVVSLKKEDSSFDRDELSRRSYMPDRNNANFNTEAYDTITDNPFMTVGENPLSTFSIDVDTASYANVRRFLTQNQLPPAGAVRIEEMVNYFPYEYSNPAGDERPFAVHVETGSAPWAHQHRLVKIGIKGKDILAENKPVTNLVFLIDVSGSMTSADKLPLLKEGMKLLVRQMDAKDHVAIAVYAGAAGMVLDSTSGKEQDKIMAAIDNLQSGGSTNGGAGIRLAYDLASKNFVKEGVNRVILASDGDFNVGTTSQDELVKLIEDKRKTGVFLSVLGFGRGNLKDSTMEKIANKGNGNYSYIDTIKEAQKVLVEQGAGTLYTIAKDVKIQVEFNPAKVQAYRLIGYENRMLAKEDFNDDTKDAGEIGAGHTVTALYEVVPVGVKAPGVPPVDALKYQTPAPLEKPVVNSGKVNVEAASNELLTVKLRYKQPDGDVSTKMDVPVIDAGKSWQDASQDYRFAAGVAQFGMLLRNSPYKGDSTYAQVLDLAQSGIGKDEKGYRGEFIQLVEKAQLLNVARQTKSE